MKLRLLTLLLLSFGVWSCESTQQAYVIVNETGTTPRLLYKDVQSNVGIAISGTYRLIGPSLRGDRVRPKPCSRSYKSKLKTRARKK